MSRCEAIALLCEPVQPPKGELEHIHYFCGNTEIPDDLKQHEPQRVALYKAAAALRAGLRQHRRRIGRRPGTATAEIAQIKHDHRPLCQAARDHSAGERRDDRPQSLRGRHAAPHRHVHRGRRAAEDFAVSRIGRCWT